MSVGLGLAIYAGLVAAVSAVMLYYYKVKYPQEEEKLKENSK